MVALRRQGGQALVIVLAFMVLSIPMVTGALGLASTLSIDSNVKTRILKRQYSGLAAQQKALHDLLASPGSSTTTLTLNGNVVTTTIVKLDDPPRDVPTYALAGALDTTKTVSPANVSSSATTTYTITVNNTNTETTTTTKFVDVLPEGFSVVTGTSVMKDSSGTTISTSNPSTIISQQQWTVPSGSQQLAAGSSMTLSFVATVTSTAGIYCNEAFVFPGGEDTTSGPTAEVTVGTTSETSCEGGLLEVTKTVDPAMVSSGVTTTYTFLIKMENKGNFGINIKDVIDTTSDGFTYDPGSTTSTPASLLVAAGTTTSVTIGEPTETDTINDTITWSFGGLGVYLATSTTWYIQFKAIANLSRGFYPNTVDIAFAGSQFASPSQADFCEFGESSLTVSQGETFDCAIGSNGDITLDQQAVVTGDVMSLNGDIVLGQQGIIGSATVAGSLIALNGDITVNQQTTIWGDILVAGNLTLGQQITVKGNIIVGGDFTLAQEITLGGYLWVGGNLTVAQQVTFEGDIISGGNVDIAQQATIGGSVWAVGTVTTDQQTTVDGEIHENLAEVPTYPPIDLRSTGSTATVTAIDIYRIITTDGQTTTSCDVYVMEDADVGTVGTVENCTTSPA